VSMTWGQFGGLLLGITNQSLLAFGNILLTEDLMADRVPVDFKKLLEEKYHGYDASEVHQAAFVYFATIILPGVNACITKFDKSKYTMKLSELPDKSGDDDHELVFGM
jgi:hypothetical protein